MDEYYFNLAPYFGSWTWKTFLKFPIARVQKWADHIRDLNSTLDRSLSLRESEFIRVLARMFPAE